MNRVKNKVALVTGGASGIGAAIAAILIEEGARVIISDFQESLGHKTATRLQCDFKRHDVGDEASWTSTITQIEAEYGALHVLVNNAGIAGPMDKVTPENTALSDWKKIHRVNVEGVFLGCKTAIPLMRRSGGGSIINMSSTAALTATPTYTAYGASKAAVRHLTKSVALHCAKDGSKIRCNSVHPGLTLTPMLKGIIEEEAREKGISFDERLKEFLVSLPQGELQELEDIANAVLYLASDEAKHTTGIKMVIDGGATI